jgi:protein-L-isoaspartate(D-aspartate) O-methyltransferase
VQDATWQSERERLVERIERHAGITNPRVLDAFRRVARERFLSEAQFEFAYDDRALPIGEGQTISQPSMIAIMLQALECQPGDRALEVGAGSGYAAALLAQLVAEVHGIEIKPWLADQARRTLAALGITNVTIHTGDGSGGLQAHAPYQRILVSAGAAAVPPTLLDQLAPGGVIAIPVGDDLGQTLLVGHRAASGSIAWRHSVPCMFVPLVGT